MVLSLNLAEKPVAVCTDGIGDSPREVLTLIQVRALQVALLWRADDLQVVHRAVHFKGTVKCESQMYPHYCSHPQRHAVKDQKASCLLFLT
ncbi:hypothetical protein SKAU_G00269710 [Synaphobranchus kaupii]|uniref:Uncharacterized protein n=1 Tax=Synaphobranchus kaupii TaxID=118154 RepID=A0A9Q1F008_SYNKA|nr:hypothetical protein SKAU_G00269710 [Synaphobranchus kaupii]